MSYSYIVSRFDRILDDETLTGLVIGITCNRLDATGKVINAAYCDWAIGPNNFASWPPTKAQLREYIRNYLCEVINQPDIDRATAAQQFDPIVIVPAPITRKSDMKTRARAPVRRYEADTSLSGEIDTDPDV